MEGLTLEELFVNRNIDIVGAKAKMTKLMADEGLPYGECQGSGKTGHG